MRAIIQVVEKAKVRVSTKTISHIDDGFLIFLAIRKTDDQIVALKMIKKIINLRIIPDQNGKLNKSIKASGGEILLVSQFTLYADISHGNRPSFTEAAPADQAESLLKFIVTHLRAVDIPVSTGLFGAHMDVELTNQGPITIILDV